MSEAFLVCAACSAGVLAYGIVLAKYIPGRWHALTNTLAAAAALGAAWLMGISISDLGLGLNTVLKGAVIGLAASLAIVGVALILASLPVLRSYFLSQHSILKSETGRIVYETVVRIPLITAFFEEIIFRAFLLAVFLVYFPTFWAVILSSIVFGLWHIFPAINSMNENHYKRVKSSENGGHLYVAGNVLFTALAGVGFCFLRVISGSIVAPWLVHWAINAGGVVSVLFAKSRSAKNLH